VTRSDPNRYAIYDDEPDKLTEATGIKIPVTSWDVDGSIHYGFEVCMFGDNGHVNVDKMHVGWGYSVEMEGGEHMDAKWDYGYKCLNSIALPDLCSGVTATYAIEMGHQPDGTFMAFSGYNGKHSQDARSEALKMQLPFEHDPVDKVTHQFTFWDMALSHQPLIVISVLIILVVGIFVSSFAYCIEKKGAKPYGQVVKFVESDVDLDDQTDSELELIEDR